MVEKVFLALDYPSVPRAREVAETALGFLKRGIGEQAAAERIGVKVNQNLFTLSSDMLYFPKGHEIFADMKIYHGAGTGITLLNQLNSVPGMCYVTVSSEAPQLSEYVIAAEKLRHSSRKEGIKIIAFTKHTKLSEEEVSSQHGNMPIQDVIFALAQHAADAKCHAVVMEAGMLKDSRIKALPIKKLVIYSQSPSQKRVTTHADLMAMRRDIDYLVVGSSYLEDLYHSGNAGRLVQTVREALRT